MTFGKKIQGMKPYLEECDFLVNEIEHYSFHQMREVFLGIQDCLHEEEIALFSSHEYTSHQMHEIRLGFKLGLSYDDILLYSSKKLPWDLMKRMRERLLRAYQTGQPFVFTDRERRIIEAGVRELMSAENDSVEGGS